MTVPFGSRLTEDGRNNKASTPSRCHKGFRVRALAQHFFEPQRKPVAMHWVLVEGLSWSPATNEVVDNHSNSSF